MAKQTLAKIGSILMMAAIMGCSSTQTASPIQTSKEYQKLVRALSVKDELYSGFTNIFHYSATLVTSDLILAQLELLETTKQWSPTEKRQELVKVNESLGNETQVFVSFFAPEIRYNDLNESGSVWRVFLDVDGKRYSATINKYGKTDADVRTLFPDHSRWSTAYLLKFPISFQAIKNAKTARLVMTGSLGVSKKSFSF